MKKGKMGVSTGGIEKSPARVKREARRRREEEKAWQAKNGAVKTVRLPTPATVTPIGSAHGKACLGNPYAGMQSGECATEATYVVGGDLPAGFVLAGVCDAHLPSVLEAFREYGKEELLVQSLASFLEELAAVPEKDRAKFLGSVTRAS